MCEASVFYVDQSGAENLLMDDVDLIEFKDEDQVRLVSIFGEQRSLRAKVKTMSLASHRVVLEKEG